MIYKKSVGRLVNRLLSNLAVKGGIVDEKNFDSTVMYFSLFGRL